MNELSSQESQFNLDELFFSKTDLRGIIQSGNSVFTRVSEYSEEELLFKPHSIIRHKDMPRAVFKLLWDFLKSGKPIVAYVKNKSKSGRYYWVLAMAFPMDDGYLSIRLKPTSPFLGVVEGLYKEMRALEGNDRTMEASTRYLNETLTKLGFSSYEDFMRQALVNELNSRDGLLAEAAHGSLGQISNERLRRIMEASRLCTESVRAGFKTIHQFTERLSQLHELSQEIARICQHVRFVTTNLTISAAKLGEAGKPLSVVSANLDKLTADILHCAQSLEKALARFQKSMTDMSFCFGTSRFQIEMMDQLIYEDAVVEKAETFFENLSLLSDLVAANFRNVEATSKELNQASKALLQTCTQLGKTTAGMDVIRVVGKIEMAQIQEDSGTLNSRLKEIEDLTNSFKDSLRNLERHCQEGLLSSSKIRQLTQHISTVLGSLSELLVS